MAKVIDGYMRDPEGNLYRPHSNAKTTDFSSDKTTATNAQDALDELYEKISETGAGSNEYTDQKIAELVNSAPETMNTLKELSDAIEEHQDVTDALDAAITNKVDKVDGKGLSTNDFTDTYQSDVDDNTTARHTHSNMTVLNNTTASYTTEEKEKLRSIREGAESSVSTVTGNNPTATNSTDGNLIYLKNSGYTEQKTLTGKNLLKNTATTRTVSGVTFTVNADRSITINGTATADADIALYGSYGDTTNQLVTGEKTIKILKTDINGVNILAGTGSTVHGISSKDSHSANIDTSTKKISWILLRVTNGITVSNKTLYPMIISSDETNTTYEPYCGGIPSPNPDYPQEIKGLGDNGTIEVRTRGKNLIDVPTQSAKTINGVTATPNEDGSITVSGTCTGDGYIVFYNAIPNDIIVGQAYTFSLNNDESISNISIYVQSNDNLSHIGVGDYNVTMSPYTNKHATASQIYKKLVFHIWGNNTYNFTCYPQLEEGTVATEFEPYQETTAIIPISAPLYEGDYIEVYADGSGQIYRDMHHITVAKDAFNKVTSPTGKIHYDSKRIYPADYYGLADSKNGKMYCNMSSDLSNPDNDGTGKAWVYTFSGNTVSACRISTDVYEALSDTQNIEFVYRLKTPTTEPLTAEQVAEFKKLYTFDEVTRINADGTITVRYYCNTDSGETVGMLQDQINEIKYNYTVTSNADFDFGSIDE